MMLAPEEAGLPLVEVIGSIPVAEEQRTGYERDSFKPWVDEDGDSCSTRAEVLLAEAVAAPERGDRCSLSGGSWLSYYDEVEVTDARKLDIDHMAPLAEAWDSGAYDWTPERREAYANDLGADRSLVAVTAKTNRSKADRDPAQWMPPAESATCTYLVDWTATKLRWALAMDEAEKAALLNRRTGHRLRRPVRAGLVAPPTQGRTSPSVKADSTLDRAGGRSVRSRHDGNRQAAPHRVGPGGARHHRGR